MAELAIPMSDVMSKVTLRIHIKGVRIANLRIKAGALLLRLAALVMGTQVEIDLGGEFDELPPPGERRSYTMVGDIEVPLQASVREGSPLFVSNVHDWGQKVDVFLDGVRQDQVISYDAENDWIRVNRLNDKGEPYVAGDEIATEVKRGRIELRPRA